MQQKQNNIRRLENTLHQEKLLKEPRPSFKPDISASQRSFMPAQDVTVQTGPESDMIGLFFNDDKELSATRFKNMIQHMDAWRHKRDFKI